MRDVIPAEDERLIVGPETLDDAGVVVLGEGEGLPAGSRLGLVQTVDFFPPVVDDPAYYGAIAAANSGNAARPAGLVHASHTVPPQLLTTRPMGSPRRRSNSRPK